MKRIERKKGFTQHHSGEAGFTQHHSNGAGFTLMEIMIVMVLLGILATVGIGSFRTTQTKGRDIRRKSDLSNISKALEAYYNDKGRYPTGTSGNMMGCYPDDASLCPWTNAFSDKNGTVYMTMLPNDPTAPVRTYVYYAPSTGVYYQLYALLENTQDADLITSGGSIQYYSGTNCGGGKFCNWGKSDTSTQLTKNHALTSSTQ